MTRLLNFVFTAVALSSTSLAFPHYQSLAGLSRAESSGVLNSRAIPFSVPETPIGPISNPSTKLVNDADHPWQPLRDGDIRGPCPGLNTLASHGYIPRNGVVTPNQILKAAQEGFNMEYTIAKFVTYAALLMDGNPLTGLLSIGRKTPLTGPDPPAPATVGGLDTHNLCEGDASLLRNDVFFGNSDRLNETLWDELVETSNRLGGGKYNVTVAAEVRWNRIQDSIARNPTFTLVDPRYITAYVDAVLPINLFVDGRQDDGQLDLDDFIGFVRDFRMPKDFHRAARPMAREHVEGVIIPHPVPPGRNVGSVNNYVPDPTSADLTNFCLMYEHIVNNFVKSVYPNPTGELRSNIQAYLQFFFDSVKDQGCTQQFPYGQN